MKLNWAERWAVNNPLRVIEQRMEIRWFKKAIALKPDATVLEVGCGRGAGAGLIQDAFQPLEMYCQDIDIQMIRNAFHYLPSGEREKIHFHVGDVTFLPFRDGSMDAVFGFGVLHHVPDWRRALSEVARVIRPGGIYFLEELYPSLYQNFITKHILLHPQEDRFISQDLRTALEESHLEIRGTMECKKLGILAVAVKNALSIA